MAEHNLRITAQLDTSDLNAELDRLNQQRGGGGTNDTTGNGVPLGQRLRQLQASLDNLNRTLKSMMRQANAGANRGAANPDIGDGLAPFIPSQNRTSIQTLPQRAALARAMIANAGADGEDSWRKGGRYRSAVMDLPQNQALAAQYQALQYQNRQDKALYEENTLRGRRDRRRMGIAVGGHFAGMIGQSLQDAGYEKAGGVFNVLGGTMGAAASGAMVGGVFGAAIGGLIGMTSSLTSEFAKLRNATENLTKQIEKNLADAFKSLERHETDNEMEDLRNTLHDEWTNLDSVENVMNVSDVRIDAISNRIEELESQLEQRRAELEVG